MNTNRVDTNKDKKEHSTDISFLCPQCNSSIIRSLLNEYEIILTCENKYVMNLYN